MVKLQKDPVKVPSVQELAKENLAFVPPRYIRPNHEPLCTSSANSSTELPVIDMQLLLSEDGRMNSELQKLDLACKDWGAFQLINHGVSTSLLEKWKVQIQDFFNLPLEEKRKLELEGSQGYGQGNIVSEEQKLDWGDAFSLVTLPIYARKTDLFSKLPSPFRKTLEAYSDEMQSLSTKILNEMAKALGMKLEDVTLLFEDGTQSLRMNYYPPCPQPELAVGLSPHSDCIGIAILLQVSDVDGLQVRKDGTWVPVIPLPNSFTIILGDILEILSNGIYTSVVHRATVKKEEARVSIVTFVSPRLDNEIAPAPSLITPDTPPKFKGKSLADHFTGCFTSSEKTYLDTVRI